MFFLQIIVELAHDFWTFITHDIFNDLLESIDIKFYFKIQIKNMIYWIFLYKFYNDALRQNVCYESKCDYWIYETFVHENWLNFFVITIIISRNFRDYELFLHCNRHFNDFVVEKRYLYINIFVIIQDVVFTLNIRNDDFYLTLIAHDKIEKRDAARENYVVTQNIRDDEIK